MSVTTALCIALSAAALAVAVMAAVGTSKVESRLAKVQEVQAEALYLRCVTVDVEVQCHVALQAP